MKFIVYNIDMLKNIIFSEDIGKICKINPKNFTRNRKIKVSDIIMYNLNNRGKTSKMELYDFINDYNELEEVSSAGFLKQREKLDPEIFKILNEESMSAFYNKFGNEVKTYKGYVLNAIDGSDCEVPNTEATRKRYQTKKSENDNRVARIKLSNCYDVLNKRVLDTEVEEYKHGEIDLAKKHINKVNGYIKNFECIYIMDRGYFSLGFIYECIKSETLFVIRLNERCLKTEQKMIKTNDEEIEIQYENNRINGNKKSYPEFCEYYINGNRIKLRFVKVKLSTGETEIIITNLSKDKFNEEEIAEIYNKRWGIETSYHKLKESMNITNISSSKDIIIKQEIYSQMTVYNIVESMIVEAEKEINQEKYKHQMTINFNMAVGYAKRMLIKILLEKDEIKKLQMFEELTGKLLKNLIPIRKDRHYQRKADKKNKHCINKRKSL